MSTDEDMTDKARRYMAYMAIYGIAYGLICIFKTGDLTSPSFDILKEVTPFGWGLKPWGWGHLVVGLTAAVAGIKAMPGLSTLALMGISSLTMAFATSFALGWYAVPGAAPTGFVIYGIFSLVNIDQSREPRTAPYERVVRKLAVDD